MSIINYDLDEEYKNALDKEAEKESRLFYGPELFS